jgi:hypothetical protein
VPAFGNADAAEAGKFFIWSSPIKAVGASIDYYSKQVRQRLEDVGNWAEEIVARSVLKDETLFVKTHAHSMYQEYFEAARRPVPPHLHPGIQSLFGVLFDGAADAGVDVEFATASEVYRRYVAREAPPAEQPSEPNPARVSIVATTPAPAIPAASGAAAEAAPVDLEYTAGELDRVALGVMRQRVATLGDTGAGTYADYGALINRGRLLQADEIAIAQYLQGELAEGQPLVVVRCGFGLLVLLLAAALRALWRSAMPSGVASPRPPGIHR